MEFFKRVLLLTAVILIVGGKQFDLLPAGMADGVCLILAAWGYFNLRRSKEKLSSKGDHVKMNWKALLGYLALGGLVSLALTIFGFVFVQLLQRNAPLYAAHLASSPMKNLSFDFGGIASIAFFAPFFEEILFRGLFFFLFNRFFGIKGGMFAAALVFGSMHPAFFPQFFVGLLWAIVFFKTRSLPITMTLHGAMNFLLMWAASSGILKDAPDTFHAMTWELVIFALAMPLVIQFVRMTMALKPETSMSP